MDVTKLIVSSSCGTEIVDTHSNGNNIRTIQIALCKFANIAGTASVGTESRSADAKANIVHTKLLCQKRNVIGLILCDTVCSSNAITDTGNCFSLVSSFIQPGCAVGISACTSIGSVALLGEGGQRNGGGVGMNTFNYPDIIQLSVHKPV